MVKNLRLVFTILLGISALVITAQPANDDCANASQIVIGNGAYGLGTFTSAQADLTNATVQAGENFYSTILAAGENKKSVWYKFSLPTARNCTLTLAQPGAVIPANDVGFTVYKANSCFPGAPQVDSALLAAQSVFGHSSNPCLQPGDYLVQVSSTATADGPIYIQLQLDNPSPAEYDLPDTSYNFGTLSGCQAYVDFSTGCQTVQDSTEVCPALGANYRRYTQSVWLRFTTPAYFDWIGVNIGPTGGCCFNNNPGATFAYNLYQGNCYNTPISSLSVVDGCVVDTFVNYGTWLLRTYYCNQLQPNTTYSIQLFFDEGFTDNVRVYLDMLGVTPSMGPEPTSGAIAASNQLGVLNSGTINTSDYFGCNARLSQDACGNVNPAGGVYYPGTNVTYRLNDWFTFQLAQPSDITFYANASGNNLLVRLFNQGVNATCGTVDTSNLYAQFIYTTAINCLPAGNYSMQILGNDDSTLYWNCAWMDNLGQKISLSLNITNVQAYNHYSLNVPGAVDTVNRVANTYGTFKYDTGYVSGTDTFGCENTVRPDGSHCNDPTETKAMYFQFKVGDGDNNGLPDSGVLFMQGNFSWNYYYGNNILYQGDANSLATAQNQHVYPDSISGLSLSTTCFGNEYCRTPRACVVPGIYTMVTYGDNSLVGDNVSWNLQEQMVTTQFRSAALAENMGDVLDSMSVYGGSSVSSIPDYFSCIDNPATIGGQGPCPLYGGNPATKLIYRQFYLSSPALVTIASSANGCNTSGTLTLFNGEATAGIGGLSPVGGSWTCFNSTYTGPCNPLPAGWYTVIAYGEGPSYANPAQNYIGNLGYGGDVGLSNSITISVTQAPPGPIYNRPYKACIDTITNQPFLITPKANSNTAAYPVTDTVIGLYTEHYNCTTDTPFSSHPVVPCSSQYQPNRVTYYVFQLPCEAYIHISGVGGAMAEVFPFDVRTDSASMLTVSPVQPCINDGDFIELCQLQPGTYTLVVFPPDNFAGSGITPSIYVDSAYHARFDNAQGAYDFGVMPTDSNWYSGKPGDVNPLDAGRAASNDFFYCTTGSQVNDPPSPVCYVYWDSLIYSSQQNDYAFDAANPGGWYNWPRRNLWYTFVLDKGGNCTVQVNAKTPDKGTQPGFSIYQSSVDGTLPFSTVVADGLVDSTTTGGLTAIGNNAYGYCGLYNAISFFKDPCNAGKIRYYVLVDDDAQDPNSQVEVNILYDTVYSTQPLYDHYSQANVINGLNQAGPPYTNVVLDSGVYYGAVDNYTCATQDPTDPNPCNCTQKNLWYTFTVGQAGFIRLRYIINGTNQYYANPGGAFNCDMNWFMQTIPGDSTSTGLAAMPGLQNNYYDNTLNVYWYQTCILPGTYYILMTGCNRTDENEQPVIWLLNDFGDYCSNPVAGTISSPGSITLTAIIDCHTIGEGFGENGSNMGCLIPDGDSIPQFKSTWFRFDVPPGDTFDITPILTDNTNVPADQIRYRLLYGNCYAMNPGSCFVTANTVNTFNCLTEGSYYIQVIEPKNQLGYPYNQVTGNISMQINAVQSQPGCNPATNCFAISNFATTAACGTDSIYFINQSTEGDSISYYWDFGFGGQTSALISPQILYPTSVNNQTYNVTLIVDNKTCNKMDTSVQAVTIYNRPVINLGPDTTICSPDTVILHATTYPGAGYTWNDGSTDSLYYVTSTGQYWVNVLFNGCIIPDTINVTVNPGPVVNLGPNQPLCPGATYSISLPDASGETFVWNDGTTQPTFSTNLPGTYWVHAAIASCTVADTIILSSTASIHPLSNDTAVCNGDTVKLDATTSLATGYLWDNGSSVPQRTVDTAGTYQVNISLGSCTITDSIVIGTSPPAVPVITGDSSICATGDSVVLSAGAGFDSYSWSTGSTASTAAAYSGNEYYVTVINTSGCQGSDSMLVQQTTAMILTTVDTNVSCYGGNNGSIQLNVNGGASPYQYIWTGGLAGTGGTNLSAANYAVTVTDNIGCTASKSDTITQPALLQLSLVDSNVSCFGLGNGKINLTVTGGVTPYQFSWSNAATTQNISNLIPATYTVVVTDFNSCTASDSGQITQPQALVASYTVNNVLCNGTNGGSAGVTLSGGTQPYAYNWSNNTTTANITAVNAGTYSISTNDANGCSLDTTLTVTQPPPLVLAIDSSFNPSCFGASDGRIYASVAGGVSPYIFNWSNTQTSAFITGLRADTYSLSVSDSNSCNAQQSATIIAPDSLALQYVLKNVSCNGANDGSIQVSVIGGTAAYSYLWSNGNTTAIDSGLAPNTYSLVITDSHNCADSLSNLVITQPQPLTITPSSTSEECVGADNGTVTANVTGGTMPYTYDWSNGGPDSAEIRGLAAGNFSLTALDANACKDTASTTVVIMPVLTLSAGVQNPVCPPINNGTVILIIGGNSGPYRYSWSGTTAGDSIADALAPGTYTVTVTDAYSCTIDTSVTLQYQYSITLQTPAPITIKIGNDTLIATTSNGTQLHYTWTPAARLSCDDCGSPVASPGFTTFYTVVGQDSNGCTASDTITVTVIPDHDLFIPNVFSPNGDGHNDYFEIFGNKAAINFLSVSIFDRWGEKLFESNDINFRWNGMYRGQLLPPQVVVYELEVSFIDGQGARKYSGSVMLAR